MAADLSICKILREAILHLPAKNPALTLTILLITLIPYSVLFLATYLAARPPLVDLAANLYKLSYDPPQNPDARDLLVAAIKADVRVFVALNLLVLLLSLIIALLQVVAPIASAAAVYRGEPFGPKLLFSKIRTSWRGPLITILYVQLLNLGYISVMLSIVWFSLLMVDGLVGRLLLCATLLLPAFLLLFHLTLTWSVGVVISVLEDGFCGIVALGKGAERVVGAGRRRWWQGYAINAVMTVGTLALTALYLYVMIGTRWTQAAKVGGGLLLADAMLVWNLLKLVALTVFYCVCLKDCGEERGRLEYSRIPDVCGEVP